MSNIIGDLLDIPIDLSSRATMDRICICLDCNENRLITIHGTCETCGSDSVFIENVLDRIKPRLPNVFEELGVYDRLRRDRKKDEHSESRWFDDGGK